VNGPAAAGVVDPPHEMEAAVIVKGWAIAAAGRATKTRVVMRVCMVELQDQLPMVTVPAGAMMVTGLVYVPTPE
jgi:hypothetical protein